MSHESTPFRGLGHGRGWGELPGDDQPVEWSTKASDGAIQGPLDLEFLRDRRLSLVLEGEQMAMLIDGNRLRAVFLAGIHHLEIGADARQVQPSDRLIFVAPDGDGLQMHWTDATPLRCAGAAALEFTGSCRLTVSGPQAFYDTFLAGIDAIDAAFVLRLATQCVQGALDRILAPHTSERSPEAGAELRTKLADLGPDDLDVQLRPCGLSCVALELRTLPLPVEAAPASGHLEDLRHN